MENPIFYLEQVVKTRTEEMEDFNGPLDLILSLLSKNKMEIQNIQISVILRQYLEYIRKRQQMDLEVASDFVIMASHLVYIKTRMLLSIHDEEALSEMEQLIANLEAHQRQENYLRIKAVAPALADKFVLGRDYIPKVPEYIPVDKTYQYVSSGDELFAAMNAMLERLEHKLPPPMSTFQSIVRREPYPLADKANELIRRIISSGVTRFRSLFKGARSRSEIVATFLAVLELCRASRLRLAGTEQDCTVTCIDEPEQTGEPLITDQYS